MKTLLVVAALSLSSFALGCSGAPTGSDGSSGSDLSADSAVSAEAKSALTGTFTAVGTNPLNLLYTSYTFASDGTFTASGGCPTSDAPASCHEITYATGDWSVKSVKISGSTQKELTLDDSLGNSDTYIYSFSGNTLTFNKTLSGDTQFFFKSGWTKDIPITDVCQDNAGNSLGACSDSGNFGCSPTGIADDVYTCNPLD